MARLRQVPLLKLFLLYASGSLMAKYFDSGPKSGVVLPCFLALLLLALFITLYFRDRLRTIFTSLAVLTMLVLGYWSYISNDERSKPDNFSHYITFPKQNKKLSYIVKITDIKKSGRSKTKLIARVLAIGNSKDTIAVSGSLLVNTDIPFGNKQIEIGDIMKFETYVYRIKPAQNPLSFNPREYYHYQNIHYQAYVKKENYATIGHSNSIKQYFRKLNLDLQKAIYDNIPDSTNANIAISIMLGDKQNLDKKLLNTFSNTGIRHILTVSGMHVGIIAILLNFLLGFIKTKNKHLNTLKLAIILSAIWFYAFLTGMGSATLRAAFMISLLMVGINIRRNINTYNLLFGSALIILIINPYQLFQLGFILSYSAMLSILIFYQPIYSCINLKKLKVLDYIWQLLSLSIAAQILIFPLSLFYFHNAPVLFILTALISTPMAFLTIALGFSIVFVSILSTALSLAIGNIISTIITYCLLFIQYIDSISINLGNFIFLDITDLIIIFSIITFIYTLLIYRIYKYGIYTAIMILLFFANHYFRNNKSSEIAVYSSYNSKQLDIFSGDKCYSVRDATPKDSNYTSKYYRIFKNPDTLIAINNFQDLSIRKTSNIIEIDGKTIVLLEDKDDLLPTHYKTINLLILGKEIDFNLKDLMKNYNIDTIILMKGMNYKSRTHWISRCQSSGVEYWDINKKGAFISKIKSI